MHDLEEIKKNTMRLALDRGCDCPVCGQFVKVYKRSISSTMARQLIMVYKKFGINKGFHARNAVMGTSTGDFQKLAYWSLIKQIPHDPDDKSKKHSGFWMVTERGEAFVLNNTELPKYALIYNSRFLGFDGGLVNIREAIGENFNYEFLMRPAINPLI